MSKLTITSIDADYASAASLNDAFDAIEAAFENTLSRDGTTPNNMSASLDMSSNDINNAKTINADTVNVNGVALVPSSVVAIDTAASVPNVPAGNLAATDVQTALNELDTEKVGLAGTETVTGDKTFSGANTYSGVSTFSNDNIHSGDNTFSGANDHTGVDTFDNVVLSEGANIASATDCNIWVNADGNTVHLTGTTTVTDWGTAPQAGAVMRVICDAATPLTHNATTNDLNVGGANYTCEAGDVLIVYAISTSAYKVTVIPYDGEPLVKDSGRIIQTVHTQDGEVASTATTIDFDDTIPQNTEGAEFMTRTITPTDSANTLRIDIVFNGDQVGNTNIIMALFQDAIADALAAVVEYGASAQPHPLTLTYFMTAGTTSEITFKVRAGSAVTSTLTFNGRNTARIFGGVMASSITVTEIKA